ncbi:MAG: LA_3696 family protein [Spirochaetia bacterium]
MPKSLRDKLGDEASEDLVKVLNEQGKETAESVIETAALRFEKKLSEELGGVKTGIGGLKYDVGGLKTDVAGLKTDVADLKTDVAELQSDVTVLKTDVADLKTDVVGLKIDFVERIGKVREEMQRLQAGTIRWMFIFWVGQIGVLFGIIYAVFK